MMKNIQMCEIEILDHEAGTMNENTYDYRKKNSGYMIVQPRWYTLGRGKKRTTVGDYWMTESV